MQFDKRPANRPRRGNALIEFSLLMPWLVFLFTGTFDFGFYSYSLISVENAARAAALHTSGNSSTAADQAGACSIAIQELSGLPNVGSSFSSSCGASPIRVSATYCDGTTACTGSSTSADGQPASFVTVTYQLPPMFHLPLSGLQSITRTVEMRLRDIAQ
jgi:Flp pilus assembly protein TadG